MALAAKRRIGGNALPRAKPASRVKEKRHENARERKRPPRRTPSNAPSPAPKHRRFMDPAILAQGMTARSLGARLQLTSLTPDEIERDLRHMEAYANACTAYAQQLFIYHNRALVQSGQFGPVTSPALGSTENVVNGDGNDPFRHTMPVRIDPEEEQRISLLRKRISISEAQREILETEYMSLRAHYVYESQKIRRMRNVIDGQLTLLKDLVRRRGTVVALRRIRCAVGRDILHALEKRNRASNEGIALIGPFESSKYDGSADVYEMWNEIEDKLREAEKACRAVPIPETLMLLKSSTKSQMKKDKKQPSDDEEDERVVPWDCRTMPGAPEEVPILLSQMSSNPERVAAWSCGGVFGSKPSSMCWDESSLPTTCDKMVSEYEELKRLRDQAQFLQEEIDKERALNKGLQVNIIGKRSRNDEMSAMMALLRSETEAVLVRHNILLETKEAKGAAQEYHIKLVEQHESHSVNAMGDLVDEEKRLKSVISSSVVDNDGLHDANYDEEHDNDGDDEGEIGEEEEEDGEVNDDPPGEVVVKKSRDSGDMS